MNINFYKMTAKIIDRLVVVFAVLLFLQVPSFIQQYSNRLAGHVAELNKQIDLMRQNALLSSKTLEQYVQKFLTHSDRDFANQGALMEKMVLRWQELMKSAMAIHDASPWTRPFVLIRHLQYDISKAAIASFQPSITFTSETMIYGLVGLGFGILISSIVHYLMRKGKQWCATYRIKAGLNQSDKSQSAVVKE